MNNSQKQRNYFIIDLVKFICSLLVVMIHLPGYAFAEMAVDGAPPTGEGAGTLVLFALPLAYTILRTAVPFFFIASAFFLFKKLSDNPDNRKEIIKKYCLRLFKLWLIWFVFSLPYMIDKFMFNSGYNWQEGLLLLVLNTIFRGGFDGAWFLIALLISVLLVEKLSNKCGNKITLLICLAFYILAVLDGCYFGLFKGTFIGEALGYINLVCPLFNSFMAGMLYVFIGKIFAQKEQLISKKLSVSLLCVSVPLMYGELLLINYLGYSIETDCFFSLVLFSICFMQQILNIQLKPKNIYLKMRKASTFIYLCHFVILYVFYRLVYAFKWTIFISNVPMTILVYFVVLGLSIGLCSLITHLSKKKGLAWLRYGL